MKKLMTIAAAAFCASAMASESGIVSANIVGYGDKTLENVEFVGPSFLKIGADQQFTYADIKVNCDDVGTGDGTGWQPMSDSIILLDSNGSYVQSLVYVPQYIATEVGISKGWYDSDAAAAEDFSDCLNSKTLDFGEAVQTSAAVGAGAKATFSGQVKETPTVIDVERVMSVANCSPVNINLGDIIVNCDDIGTGDGTGWQPMSDSIILLDSNGSYVQSLVYVPQYIATEVGVSKGWYDSDAVAAEDFSDCWNEKLVINAGEGIQVSASVGAKATITIKSALAK